MQWVPQFKAAPKDRYMLVESICSVLRARAISFYMH
jgi:hypothetical protein